jgi:spore coat protein A, manganese oxidase
MLDRRSFLKYMGAAGAAAALVKPAFAHRLGAAKPLFVPPPGGPPYPAGPYPSGPYPTSDPAAMNALQAAKYSDPLLSQVPVYTPTVGNTYNVSMVQTTGQVSSVFGNVTKVYAYSGQTTAGPLAHYPGASFDVFKGTAITVNYTSNLANGPHILPTDPTIDGATVMSMYPYPGGFPAGYTYQNGTVGSVLMENRVVVHLHGGDVNAGIDDGWPDFWLDSTGAVAPNVQTCQYPNNQPACCLWYHDHGMATTRLNVHAGLAGFYFIRDAVEQGLNIPQPGNDAAFEVPLVIQDRMFDANGQFLMPHQGSGGMIVNPAINQQPWPSGHPYWVPEFFGDVAVVNGTAWPNLQVEQRKYRFRLLNGCNARHLNLRLFIGAPLGSVTTLPFNVIGTDQGFLKNNAPMNPLFMGPAFRYDTIVDFTKLPIGTMVFLVNDAPGPWPGGGGNVLTEIMNFTVVARTGPDNTVIPAHPDPSFAPIPGPVAAKRYITLNEWIDPGTLSSQGMMLGEGLGASRFGLPWGSPVTITPALGTTEDWYFVNRTGDGHPMHLHLVRFQVRNRFYIDAAQYDNFGRIAQVGPTLAAQAFDHGWKDTVLVPPGDGVNTYQVTVIRANFQRAGAYPYHCHIIDHEDNDMMRWFQVI